MATGLVDGVHGLAELYYAKFGFLMGVTRILGSLLSVGAVYLLLRLAWGLADRLGGWLAAAALAFAWLDIVCCHYPTADVPSAFMLLASVVWAWRLYQRPAGRRDYILGGLLAGAAGAIKYPAAAGLVAMLAAHFLARRPAPGATTFPRRPRAAEGAALLLLATALGFLVLCPWAILDWPDFFADMVYQRAYNASGPEPAWQLGRFFFGMTPPAGLGAPLNALALLGLAWFAARRPRDALVVLSGPTLALLAYASTNRFMSRWYETVVPFVALGVGMGACAVSQVLGRAVRSGRAGAWLASVVVAGSLAPPVAQAARYDWILLQPGTRRTASGWIEQSVPAGAHVVLTQWRWASPDVPQDKYRTTWLVVGSPERLYAGLRLKALLDGPVGHWLRKLAPRGLARLRQRQEAFLTTGQRLEDLLPPLPKDAEWAVVNLRELSMAAANACGAFEPVPGVRYEAFGPLVLEWSQTLLSTLHERAEQRWVFTGSEAEEHPWGVEPYGSPTLVIFRLAPTGSRDSPKELDHRRRRHNMPSHAPGSLR